jgi:hypothetical protein
MNSWAVKPRSEPHAPKSSPRQTTPARSPSWSRPARASRPPGSRKRVGRRGRRRGRDHDQRWRQRDRQHGLLRAKPPNNRLMRRCQTAQPVSIGHRFLPTGGHEFPHWWQSFLPSSEFGRLQVRGFTPLAARRLRELVAVLAGCCGRAHRPSIQNAHYPPWLPPRRDDAPDPPCAAHRRPRPTRARRSADGRPARSTATRYRFLGFFMAPLQNTR